MATSMAFCRIVSMRCCLASTLMMTVFFGPSLTGRYGCPARCRETAAWPSRRGRLCRTCSVGRSRGSAAPSRRAGPRHSSTRRGIASDRELMTDREQVAAEYEGDCLDEAFAGLPDGAGRDGDRHEGADIEARIEPSATRDRFGRPPDEGMRLDRRRRVAVARQRSIVAIAVTSCPVRLGLIILVVRRNSPPIAPERFLRGDPLRFSHCNASPRRRPSRRRRFRECGSRPVDEHRETRGPHSEKRLFGISLAPSLPALPGRELAGAVGLAVLRPVWSAMMVAPKCRREWEQLDRPRRIDGPQRPEIEVHGGQAALEAFGEEQALARPPRRRTASSPAAAREAAHRPAVTKHGLGQVEGMAHQPLAVVALRLRRIEKDPLHAGDRRILAPGTVSAGWTIGAKRTSSAGNRSSPRGQAG